MSHFAAIKSSFKDRDALIKALVACGVPRDKIEVHEKPVPVLDYCGRKTHYRYKDTQDLRFKNGDCGHIVIRQEALNGGSTTAHNDACLYLDGDKSEFILCDYALSAGSPLFRNEDGERVDAREWVTCVKHAYQHIVVKKQYPYQEVEREFVQTDKGRKQRLVIRE